MLYYTIHMHMGAHHYAYHRNICIQHYVHEVVPSEYPGKTQRLKIRTYCYKKNKYFIAMYTFREQDRVVGIANHYGLDGSGIETWWRAKLSAPVQTRPDVRPASYKMGTGSLSRG